MNKKDFLSSMNSIDERFINEADAPAKRGKWRGLLKRPAALIAAIVALVAMSVTAVSAVVPLIVPPIPKEAVESLNIRPTTAEEREAESKRVIRESLEKSRELYGDENFTASDEEVDEVYDELHQNSMQKLVAEASGGMIRICHYDTTIPDLDDGKIHEGTGYFYDGYLPVIYIEIRDADGKTTGQTFQYDATLAKYGAFARFTAQSNGTYELEFIEIGDALDGILVVAAETITPGTNVKKADGSFDYAAFYAALTSVTHREYFAILFSRAGVEI